MGFKSKEIIIGAPLVLNKLPKYWDKIKSQSALDFHPKINISVSVYSSFCCGAWDLENVQSALDLHQKRYFRFWPFIVMLVHDNEFQLSLDPLRKTNITVFGFTSTMKHENRKSVQQEKASPQKWGYPNRVHAQCLPALSYFLNTFKTYLRPNLII